jgi:hypothetical protein
MRAIGSDLAAATAWAAAFASSTALAEPAPAETEPPPRAEQPSAGPEPVIPPKLLSDPNIPYPLGARGDATLVLLVIVAADGSVQSAIPEQPHAVFAPHAVQAVLGWRFEPATRGGRAVAAKIRLEVAFREPEPEPVDVQPQEPAKPATPAAAREEYLEVTVRGEHAEPSRSASLTRAEVRQIPGAFGDPFRAIEALPGVTPIVSGLPFFFVRGAPPGNVGYFLDGIRVPLLFHVGVGPSVIHPGLVERVDLYPGGYPARFGRVSGGVVAGETLAPETELRGEYNVRVFDAGALVEAPFAEGRGSVLAGGRYSYTAALLSVFAPDTTLEYWDYQGRASYALTPDDRVGVFAFGSYDFVGQRAETETLTLFGTEFHRVDARYDRRLGGGGKLRTGLTVGIDRSRAQAERHVRARMAAGRTELELRTSPDVLVRAGSDLELVYYDIELGQSDLSPTAARVAEFFPSRTDLALGVRGDIVWNVEPRLIVTPGVRVDLYGSEGEAALGVDPRLALRTLVTERLSILTALGLAHQPPSFVVPLPGFQPGGLRGGLQRSIQESVGIELDLGDATSFTASVFQNAFFDMSDPLGSVEPDISGCPPGSYPEDTIGGDRAEQSLGFTPFCGPRFPPGTLGPDRTGGGGQAADSRGGRRIGDAFEVRTMGVSRGLELFLKRRLTHKLGGYLSYTLSRSTRSYRNRSYVAAFDRTHVTNAALAYDLGKNWRAGTRVVFYTGLPTPPDPVDGSTRLPPFFRLDLRLEKRWQISEKIWISGVAEWMNSTLSKEAVATTCTLQGCESQVIGPVTIPSLGVEGGF